MASEAPKPTKQVELNEKNIQGLKKMSHLSETEIRDLFDSFRQCGTSGQLTREEFAKLWNSTTSETEDPEKLVTADRLFSVFDRDHSGKIDFNEFLTASVLLRSHSKKQKLTLLFALCDMNHDGFLSKEEIEKFFLTRKASSGNMKDEDIQAFKTHLNTVFEQFDRNKDGKMSHKEFNNLCNSDEFFKTIVA